MKKTMLDEFFKLIRFGITGVMNTAVDFVVFIILGYIGVPTYPAQAISYSCGMMNSYIINRSWTFKSKGRFWSKELIKFVASNMIQMLLSIVLLWVFISKVGMIKLVAKFCSTVIILFIGFFINRIWVFG